ncbi:MAG: AGE family epimerase/isomerase [Lachnospiraceae bacterium]|nr:AGE family epimerase/isomerase [Lachnospiraceae bacterium]
MNTKQWKTELRQHLTKDLIPFWKGMRDAENGGFYGYMDTKGKVDKKAEKGCILNSRILWFFSSACTLLGEKSLRPYMDQAYTFLKESFLDKENGGLYWSVTYDGKPADDTKHTYNQAFAIYGLCAYYENTKQLEALDLAGNLYELIEERMRDEGGYLEAFDVDFAPVSNEKLSENGVEATRTMNTLLHVMEAYTELYRVTKNLGDYREMREKVAQNLREMFGIIEKKIYNPVKRRQEVFFDQDYHSLIDLYSYGHDIESAWLIQRGLEVLGEEETAASMMPLVQAMTEETYKQAYVHHSMPAECEKGVVDERRVWWVQAEAITGFYNGYQNWPERAEYAEAARSIWEFVKAYVMMPGKTPTEWYWYVDKDGKPALEEPIVEPWKCPYHNGRMCMEMIRRLS